MESLEPLHVVMRAPRLFRPNMNQNKRGISPVIATVLIIMITISAIAIIAGFLVPFVRNSLQKSTECTSYSGYYLFDESFGYNCYNGSIYKLSIKANFENSLATSVNATKIVKSNLNDSLAEGRGGMKVVLNEQGGTSKVLEIKNNTIGSVNENGISIAGDPESNLRLPGPGGIVTYEYQSSAENKFVSAEVYPILKSGRICADQKESINIKPC